MITPDRASRTGTAVTDSPDVVVSVRRGGNNRLPLLAMMVPLLLLVGIGLTGLARRFASRPPVPGTLAKAKVEAIVLDLTEQITNNNAEILSTTVQVGFFTHPSKPYPEWSVISRAGEIDYLFRVNGMSGKVFAINRMDDISGQGPNLRSNDKPIEAGLSPTVIERPRPTRQIERNSDGREAAESAARHYLPTLGLNLRDVCYIPSQTLRSYQFAEGGPVVWSFTYYVKPGTSSKNAIRLSVDGDTGRLESYWNPTFAHQATSIGN